MHRPSWFVDGQVLISNASTCGINKDGEELYVVDAATGEHTNQLNDQLREDVRRVLGGLPSETVQWVPVETMYRAGIAVPAYYDMRFDQWFDSHAEIVWPDFRIATWENSKPMTSLPSCTVTEVQRRTLNWDHTLYQGL